MHIKPHRKLLISLLALLALAATACGKSSSDSAGGEAGSTTTSTTATSTTTAAGAPPATAAPTATAPPSTTAPSTTAPSTTITTTTIATTLAPSTGVIVGAEGVLGWSVGGEWKTIADGPLPAAAGDVYQVVRLGDAITSLVGPAPGEGCGFVGGPPLIDVGFSATTWPYVFPIAISADWDLVPHDISLLSLDSAAYKTAASETLAARGITDPDPTLTSVIRVDLEGDGTDEILIGAERNTTGSLNPAADGDYSLLLLRKVIEGDVQTAVLAFHSVVGSPDPTFIVALDALRFSSVADLNGDGRMEIIYNDQYYEGSSTVVVDYVDNDLGPVEVLRVGCGS